MRGSWTRRLLQSLGSCGTLFLVAPGIVLAHALEGGRALSAFKRREVRERHDQVLARSVLHAARPHHVRPKKGAPSRCVLRTSPGWNCRDDLSREAPRSRYDATLGIARTCESGIEKGFFTKCCLEAGANSNSIIRRSRHSPKASFAEKTRTNSGTSAASANIASYISSYDRSTYGAASAEAHSHPRERRRFIFAPVRYILSGHIKWAITILVGDFLPKMALSRPAARAAPFAYQGVRAMSSIPGESPYTTRGPDISSFLGESASSSPGYEMGDSFYLSALSEWSRE